MSAKTRFAQTFAQCADHITLILIGTENVPGIIGFGKAIEIAAQEMGNKARRLTSLREEFIKGLLSSIEGTRLNGHPVQRLPNNVNARIDGIDGEEMLLHLRLESICASNGSAYNSSSTEPSHVLLAMGLSEEAARGALRFTLGRQTTERDIARLLDVLTRVVDKLRICSKQKYKQKAFREGL